MSLSRSAVLARSVSVVALSVMVLSGCGSGSKDHTTPTATASPSASVPTSASPSAAPTTTSTPKTATPKHVTLPTAGRVCTSLEEPLRAYPGHMLSIATRGHLLHETQELQSMINGAGPGTHCIPEDGDFGPVTRTAVITFQKVNGLVVDGKVGPETWERLQLFLSH